MTDPREGLGQSPALYPFAFDPARDALLFVAMDRAAYRAASFLDERMRPGGGAWLSAGDTAGALEGARDIRPLHFIFHAGHVGSTLLSRLVEDAARVLSLREPLPLRTIAGGFDARAPGVEARLEMLLRLWERGFDGDAAVVLKATSSTQRLAVTLLAMRPLARAVMLNVSAESYLATMLAGENSAADLNAQGPERLRRASLLIGAEVPRPQSLGELAAMSWLAEALTQDDAARRLGGRVLRIDFDAMLEAPSETLARVLAHFEVGGTAALDALSRYSKAPEQAYSPELRRRVLDQARGNFAPEIRDALAWLDGLRAKHSAMAALR